MPLSKLYGYIPNPNTECEVLYILKEIQVSSTKYRYEGLIGYGYHEDDFSSVPPITVFDSNTGEEREEDGLSRAVENPDFPFKYIPSDMREFKFEYDLESNKVILDTYWRYEMYEKEAKRLKKNVEIIDKDENDDEDDENEYPYLRFPRSKDGIAISRVFDFIFGDKDTHVIVSKKLMG